MPENTSSQPEVTRRDALRVAGAAGVAAAALPFQGPAVLSAQAANEPVNFGMIGTGSRGSYLLKHLKAIGTGRCVAICDINQDHLDKAAATMATTRPSTRTTTSY